MQVLAGLKEQKDDAKLSRCKYVLQKAVCSMSDNFAVYLAESLSQ